MNATQGTHSSILRIKDVLNEAIYRFKKRFIYLFLTPVSPPGQAGRFAGWALLIVGLILLIYMDDADDYIRDLGLTTATMAWAKLSLVSAAGTLLIVAAQLLTRSILPLLFVTLAGMWMIVSSDIFNETKIAQPLAKHGTSKTELSMVTRETFDKRLIRSYPRRIEGSPIGPDWRATSVGEHPHRRGMPTFLEADDKLRQVTEEKLHSLRGKILSIPIDAKNKETVDRARKEKPNN